MKIKFINLLGIYTIKTIQIKSHHDDQGVQVRVMSKVGFRPTGPIGFEGPTILPM